MELVNNKKREIYDRLNECGLIYPEDYKSEIERIEKDQKREINNLKEIIKRNIA